MEPEQNSYENQMMQFILSAWISKPIHVAAKLGIPDILARKGRNIEELAEMTGTLSAPLYRMMRALSGIGVFAETENRTFINTPLSECLTEERLRFAAIMFHSSWHSRMWDNLLYSVQTGKPAFEKVHGIPVFKWFENNPEDAEIFHKANSLKAASSHRVIVETYDFTGVNTIMDIGGGFGSLLVEILKANPHMTGSVAELPEVLGYVNQTIKKNGLENRMEAVGCDFFNGIPGRVDACVLSHILHDWPDEKCITIMKNCSNVLNREGKLIVLEAVIPSGNTFSISKLLDLEVFLMGGGCERSGKEFEDLMEQSGFRLSRIIDTKENISIIEGVPV